MMDDENVLTKTYGAIASKRLLKKSKFDAAKQFFGQLGEGKIDTVRNMVVNYSHIWFYNREGIGFKVNRIMKNHFLIHSFILFFFFSSCDNVQVKKPYDEHRSKKSDSVKSLHDAIYLSDKYEKAAVDSLKKYHLTEIADSCLKFFYVVNCMKKFNDDLWCKDNSLTIGESEIKLTGFIDKGMDQKQILFGAFLNDSIPCSIDLKTNGGEIPIGFIVSVKKKSVIDVLIGQYTRMDFNDFKMDYDSVMSSNNFKSYLNSKSNNIHPTFKRLLSR